MKAKIQLKIRKLQYWKAKGIFLMPMLPGLLGQLTVTGLLAKLYGVNQIKGYIEEHEGISVNFSLGTEVAIDAEISFSKQGLTTFME